MTLENDKGMGYSRLLSIQRLDEEVVAQPVVLVLVLVPVLAPVLAFVPAPVPSAAVPPNPPPRIAPPHCSSSGSA